MEKEQRLFSPACLPATLSMDWVLWENWMEEGNKQTNKKRKNNYRKQKQSQMVSWSLQNGSAVKGACPQTWCEINLWNSQGRRRQQVPTCCTLASTHAPLHVQTPRLLPAHTQRFVIFRKLNANEKTPIKWIKLTSEKWSMCSIICGFIFNIDTGNHICLYGMKIKVQLVWAEVGLIGKEREIKGMEREKLG